MDSYVDLAVRHSGAIEVTLLWNRADSSLVVVAHDGTSGETVRIPVTGGDAAEVYRHPFAYSFRSIEPAVGASV